MTYLPFIIVSTLFICVTSTVIGIDFGTSSYKVVLVQRDFNLVLNEQSSRKTKNVISLKDDLRHFGSQAENLARFAPQHSYNYLRDFLGKPSPDSIDAKKASRYILYTDKLVQSTAPNKDGTPSNYTYISVVVDDHTKLGVHEMVAMILSQARKMAEKFAGGSVIDCVITVPAFFTQRERLAILDAATLSGLKVLSFINEGTAFALKYAIDRTLPEGTAEEYVLFYGHGEGSLQLTLAHFSKTKNKKNDTVPQVRVVATHWERELGVREFDQRMAESFAADIEKKNGVKISENPRAFMKLLSEIKKAREVLSANKEASFFVEGIANDVDFSGKITREEFEKMNSDLFSRISPAIDSLLKSADITREKISAVEMVGAAVRIQKIQEVVKEYFGRETLDFHLNADEGAVFGAAFFAAGLSVQHRVREMKLKDFTPWKVSVNVSDVSDDGISSLEIPVLDENEGESLDKFATLFRRGNRYGSRKTLSFHTSRPFLLQLRYDEGTDGSEGLDSSPLPEGTDPLIEQYLVDGLPNPEIYNFSGKPKVHVQFLLSTSGIIELVKAEAEITVVEYVAKAKKVKSVVVEEEDGDEEEGKADDEKGQEEEKMEEGEKKEDGDTEGQEKKEEDKEKKKEKKEKKEEKEEEEKEKKEEEEEKEEREDEEEEKAEDILSEIEEEIELEEVRKIRKIPLQVLPAYLSQLPPHTHRASLKLLNDFDERDRVRFATENAKNDLEAYIYDTKDRLYDDLVISMSTEEERQKLSDALSEATEWLESVTDSTTLSELTSKKSDLVSSGEGIFFRVRESTARVEALMLCLQTINMTRVGMENITKRNEVTEEEVNDLFVICDTTEKWMADKYMEQEKLETWKDPVFTSEQVNTKCKEVTRVASRLMRRPKRKPPKKEVKIEEEVEVEEEEKGDTDDGNTENKPETTQKDEKEEDTKKTDL